MLWIDKHGAADIIIERAGKAWQISKLRSPFQDLDVYHKIILVGNRCFVDWKGQFYAIPETLNLFVDTSYIRIHIIKDR